MKRRGCLVMTLGLALGVLAQEPGPKEPGDERLKSFIGTWDVVVKFKTPDGQFREGKSACETKWALAGKFVHQEYRSHFGGQPFTVWQILGFDTQKKQYVLCQLESGGMGTRSFKIEGDFSKDGKALTLSGPAIDSGTGRPSRLRTVTTIRDRDHFTIEEFFTPESGGAEELKVTVIHNRRGSK